MAKHAPSRKHVCSRLALRLACLHAVTALVVGALPCPAQRPSPRLTHLLPTDALAREHFGNDAPWFLANIPLLEIDDPEIQRVYYYRWKLYRAHIREIGDQGTAVTEFLTDVPWARHPYTDLNDSSSFHILEGRWLRNPAYIESLVDHLYSGGGNDRHFSESIAAATYAWTEVTGNPAPALRHLDAMEHIYSLWDDHFDAQRNLYFIEPLLDATEYTISSIDASGAGFTDKPSKRDFENGFTGGYAFRPSINAYQFANARAIAHLAEIAGKPKVAADYSARAKALQDATLKQLWNPALNHFTDIYQRSTPYVTAGTFIRGRELVGYVPWMYELPPAFPGIDYSSAWKHVLASSELAGPSGLRTVEPTYARYLHQYRFDQPTGLPECQWNGPSWPFQTSQALTAMANLLHDYRQTTVTAADYVHLLRQYTHQHMLTSGTLDLQEDYNPDAGQPVVGLPRSHHYNHSTYVDLVLTGLLGIRPHADDVFEIDPLLSAPGSVEKPIHFFALQNLRYHEHNLTVVYDESGDRYHLGKGLSVFSDGLRMSGPSPLHRTMVPLKRGPPVETTKQIDAAVNVWARPPSAYEASLPIAHGTPATDDAHLYEAIDGRAWFFPEITNGWAPMDGNQSAPAPLGYEFSLDLRQPVPVDSAELFFFSDDRTYVAPASFELQALVHGEWSIVPTQRRTPSTPLANGVNTIHFPVLRAQQFRLVLHPASSRKFRLIEFKLFRAPPAR